MTRERAMAIRAAQLAGIPVSALDLQAAIAVLGSKRSNKMRIPPLRREIRERVNAILCFNLGKAIGQ